MELLNAGRQHSRRQLRTRRQDSAVGYLKGLPRRLAGRRYRPQIRLGYRGCHLAPPAPSCGTDPPASSVFHALAVGTNAIARAVAASKDAISIIGGGDSVSAINQAGVSQPRSPTSPPVAAPALLEIPGRPSPAWKPSPTNSTSNLGPRGLGARSTHLRRSGNGFPSDLWESPLGWHGK